MVTVDKAVVARLKTNNGHFEVLVDCEKALQFKQGASIGLADILASDDIFKDSAKGLRASKELMQKEFKTTDADEVAKEIIKRGEVQLTMEHRKKEKELKRRQIIESIHRNCVDPKTHLPHPVTRIENAFAEGRIKVAEKEPVEKQMQDIIKRLQAILPMKFEKKEVAIKMSPQYVAKCHQPIRQFGKVLQEEWQRNGDYIAVVEIPAGIQNEFFDKLNALTKANVEVKIINTK